MTTVLAYDIGTTGVKTCIFEIAETVVPLASTRVGYGLRVVPGGGIEQDPDDWWNAMVQATHHILDDHPHLASMIEGISFCSQMQSVVLVDEDARPVHPSMSYMDQRAGAQLKQFFGRGPTVAGVNVTKLVRSLYHTGAVSASIKDPVWKYHWVRQNRPDAFARVHAWLDVKESLIARMTGRFVMSEDSAFATLLYDIRSSERRFSPGMVKMLDVDPSHLPTIVGCTDVVGPLLGAAADELGLPDGIPVIAGGGDASLIGVGAGATRLGDTHIYMGTSGWVSTVTDKVTVDTSAMIATVVGAIGGRYNYFAELETAGKCLEWVRDHLALDEIDIYLRKIHVADDPDCEVTSLYDYLSSVIDQAPAGAGGVLFAPWLHGNRCPFEDPNARGMFFNIGLETGKTELIRSVVEGVCYHLRWFVETQAKKVRVATRVRFVGGGALSDITAQILADVLQRPVDVVANPQDVGAVGAALAVTAGLNPTRRLADMASLIPVARSFEPRPEHRETYDRMFAAFVSLHASTKKIFAHLNQEPHGH